MSKIKGEGGVFQRTTEKGQANGYAPLNGAGQVPSENLPSYVDDVLEYADLAAFPVTGETGKIYVAIDTNISYRWSGSEYIAVTVKDAILSNVTGIAGAIKINNMVSISQADYDNIVTPDPNTIYNIV